MGTLEPPLQPSFGRQGAAALLVLVGTTAFLFWPLLLGWLTGEPRYLEWDVPEQYWPDLVYLCESLHAGELPYWNPYDRAGYPYYADPQSAAYHPMNWAICAVAGSRPGLPWAELRVLLGFFFAGAFSLLWLRRLAVPWSAALLGAVIMQAAPFMRHNWELNLTTALGFLPLMLWAADRAAVERRPVDGVALALATALCAWVGSPPALYFACSITLLYGLARFAVEFRRLGPSCLAPGLRCALWAGAFTLGFIGVIVVPGSMLAEYSIQAGRSYESISDGALELDYSSALVWPKSGNHLYVGLLPLLLAPAALRGRRGRRLLPAFMAAVAVVAVLLALGDNGPLFRFAFDWVPGVSIFRLPHRYEAWLGPCFAVLAAFGIASLTRAPRLAPHRRRLESLLFGVLLVALHLADVSRAMPSDRHTRSDALPCGAELAARVLPLAPGTDGPARYMDEFGVGCRSGTRHRRRDLRGYQDPLQLKAYERVVDGLRTSPGLAPQYNVRFALQGPHFIHGWDRHYLPPPDELLGLAATSLRGAGVVEFTDALPFAYFVPGDEVERHGDRPSALRRVRELAPAPVAILDDAVFPAAASIPGSAENVARRGGEALAAQGIELSTDRVAFTVDAPGDGVVVVNEAWYPGWRASVDGEVVPVFRANGLMRAVPITAGRHSMELRFAPDQGRRWRRILLATWLASALVFAWPLLRRRRVGRAPKR